MIKNKTTNSMNKREIRFRGKRVDNGEWVHGYYFDGYILQYIDLAQSWTPLTSDHKVTCRAFEVIPESVGQYCGLKDKNNKEIYEGDILCAIRKLDCFHPDLAMLPEYQPKKEYRVAEFKIDNDGISFLLPREARYNERGNPVRWEIVGNIYETPHLIKNQTS